MHATHQISTIEQLEALYGQPGERARQKQSDHLDALCQRFIAAAPFMLFASCGDAGTDCSPRGDQPGFVAVADAHTLLIPDRAGNNRIDSLRNVITNPQVGLLFLIPGVTQCLRVNGRASISIEPALLTRFTVDDIAPKSVMVVRVEQAFVQCSRALLRSGLWRQDGVSQTLLQGDFIHLLEDKIGKSTESPNSSKPS
ncbi:MSMEG_1061 family FMN-dependent PPOX-type flavoprotein [Actimicrobium antarcticum]|uniref:Pyridoxamine 5'-phosphate oxidase family protein n=1 Tax=Actimicrobium antarcticum TaxID=1051899 RepID=A0ABP7TNV7_9BURK